MSNPAGRDDIYSECVTTNRNSLMFNDTRVSFLARVSIFVEGIQRVSHRGRE